MNFKITINEKDCFYFSVIIFAICLFSFGAGRVVEYLSNYEEHSSCTKELKGFKTAHFEAEKAIKNLGLIGK